MEAETRLRCCYRLALVFALVCLAWSPAQAASQRTQNFLINAPTPELAQAVAEAAERYRRDLAIHWLGAPLPAWPNPCPIRVVAGHNLAAQGVTTYNPAPVRDFQMEVIGTPERILDSVLPHEVTHTILATYFGRPLPRWADEGICTTVEHVSERSKHEAKLREFLRSRRGIAMNQLFLMKEYPADVLPMYAQGYSVCRFLIDQKGPRVFIEFLGDYMRRPSWTANVKQHYGYDSLKELQDYWLSWVAAGGGPVERFAKSTTNGNGPAADQLANAANGGGVRQASATASLTAPQSGPAPQSIPGNTSTSSDSIAGGSAVSQPRQDGQPSAMDLAGPATSAAASAAASGATAGIQVLAEGPATQLASTQGDGFYLRKRREVESRDEPAGPLQPIKPMVPPSVLNSGPYQMAHPQPEQQMSRSGSPIPWSAAPGASAGQFTR